MPSIEEIKARLRGLQNRTKKQNDIYKPKDKHVVRLLPYPHGPEPFLELGFHYDIGNSTVLCPRHNFGKDCTICDFCDKLKSWQDEDGNDKPEKERKADWELFKKLQVKERYYAPLVERGKETEGAKFWAFSRTLLERLLGMCANEKYNKVCKEEGYGVLTNPEVAFDLELNFKQPQNKDGKGNDKPFGITEVELADLAPCALAKTKADTKKIVDSVKPIFEVYAEQSSEEVDRLFMKYIGSGGEAVKGDEGDVGKEYKPNTSEKPVVGGQSIDDAFEDLIK